MLVTPPPPPLVYSFGRVSWNSRLRNIALGVRCGAGTSGIFGRVLVREESVPAARAVLRAEAAWVEHGGSTRSASAAWAER